MTETKPVEKPSDIGAMDDDTPSGQFHTKLVQHRNPCYVACTRAKQSLMLC